MKNSQSQFPKLRIVPIEKLILHERSEPKRVKKLVQRIKEDGHFRNPIIAANFNNGSKFLVLDGVHRVKSLTELGCKYAVVQIIDYFDKRVKLQTWDRLLLGCGIPKLLEKIKLIKGINLLKGNQKIAETMLRKKNIIGYFLFRNGDVFLIKNEQGGFEERTEKLLALIDVCQKISEFDRIPKTETLFFLEKNKDAEAALIMPKYSKKEVLKIAKENKVLPAGATRHIVPSRVLGLDIDLAMLRCDSSLRYKNKLLKKYIAQRIREKRMRFYQESVFVLDE